MWLELAAGQWHKDVGGVFHGTFNAVPLRAASNGGTVLTVHDLAPQRFAEDFVGAKRAAWRLSTWRSIRTADAVIVPSAFIRDEAASHWDLDPSLISVIPNAASQLFSPDREADADRVTKALRVRSPYVVALGGAPRRNLSTAIEAWQLARRRLGDLDLVVLGEGGLPPQPGLVQAGHLVDEDFAALLAGAHAFVYPTKYEGFGMPALEASACGTPVVCARVASLPEILGDAAAWSESAESGPMADALVRLLSDDVGRTALAEAALERARTAPTWDDNATATLAVYERVDASTRTHRSDQNESRRDDGPDVSVVIVNWNAGEQLIECLDSLRANPPSRSFEVVVVDNASGDGSADRVRNEMPWVRLIVNDKNRGLAPANNQGIASTGGEFVLISNPDVVFRPGAVDALIDLLERRPAAAFAVSRLLHPDGTPHPAAGDLPTLTEAFVGRQLGRGSSDSGYWWREWAHDEERRIGHGGEACYLVRRTAIEGIGPQDEHYPLDWEGIEWSRRAATNGWEVWFCHTAEVVHAGGVSVRQALARWIVQSHRGMYRYFRVEVPLVTRPLLWLAVVLRATAKLVLLRFTGSGLYEAANLRVAAADGTARGKTTRRRRRR